MAGLWAIGFYNYTYGLYAENRVVNGSATPCTLTLNIVGGIDQFFGTLGGSGAYENNFAVVKKGPGTFRLHRGASWTSGTTINEGMLELNSEFYQGNQYTGTFNIASGATLAVSGVIDSMGFNGVTVNFLSDGGGTFTNLGGDNWLNWYVANGLTLRTNGGARNTFSAKSGFGLNLNGSGVLFDVARGSDATSDLTVSCPLINGGGITKTGNGIMTLSGANTYSGSTTVNAGKLIVSSNLGSTSSVSIASNATLEVAGGNLAVSGNLTNNGTLIFTDAAQFSTSGSVTNNGIIINRSSGLSLPGNIVNNGIIYNLPVAPSGLSAVGRNAEVNLSWSAVSDATEYIVFQSSVSGGPYTEVARLSGTAQLITGLSNGVNHYFVVSAINPAGESAKSSQLSAVPNDPTSGLLAPRVSADIGAVGRAGSAQYLAGLYSIEAAGAGVLSDRDGFRFVHQNSAGNCSVAVRVDSLTNTSSAARAGVMIRESLADNARCAGVYLTPTNELQFVWRTDTGAQASVTSSTGGTAPYWVRLTRTNNVFRAYFSTNGTTWTQFGGNKIIAMSASARIGTAVTSGTATTRTTAVLAGERVAP